MKRKTACLETRRRSNQDGDAESVFLDSNEHHLFSGMHLINKLWKLDDLLIDDSLENFLLKIHFLYHHIDYFDKQLASELDEHGERFYQVAMPMEARYEEKKIGCVAKWYLLVVS